MFVAITLPRPFRSALIGKKLEGNRGDVCTYDKVPESPGSHFRRSRVRNFRCRKFGTRVRKKCRLGMTSGGKETPLSERASKNGGRVVVQMYKSPFNLSLFLFFNKP